MKARFSALGVEVLVHLPGGRADITFTAPDVRAAHALGDLAAAAACFELLEAAHRGDAPLEAHFRFNGERLGTGMMGVPGAVARPLLEWAGLVRNAWTVARDAELPAALAVRAADLARSRAPLQLTAALVNPSLGFLRVEGTVAVPASEADKVWCVPVAAESDVGGYAVRVAAGLFGRPVVLGAADDGSVRYRLDPTERRVGLRRVYAPGEAPEESMDDLLEAVSARFAEEAAVVRITRGDPPGDGGEEHAEAGIFVPRPA